MMSACRRVGVLLWIVAAGWMSAPGALAEERAGSELDPYQEFVTANRLASAGAISRSVPHYENVIRLAGERYPLAHFNLAEVQKHRRNCAEAVVLYQAYLGLGDEEDVVRDARAGIAECKGDRTWPTLVIEVPALEGQALEGPALEGLRVRINGYVVARGKAPGALELAPGDYVVEVSATDHHPFRTTVTLAQGGEGAEPTRVAAKLVMQTFYGELLVEVDRAGAQIRIHPREVLAPGAPTDVLTFEAPMSGPVRLVTGRYFVEITKPDHHRWIRNVQVSRDGRVEVRASLQRELPPEIR